LSNNLAIPDRERIDAAERELQAFSYIVSHDLAASFRQVAGFSQLLLSEFGDDLTSRQQTHACHIRTATDKCQSMLEQLLVLSRVQQKVLSVQCLDATAIAQLAEFRLSAEIRAAGAEVSIVALGEVMADPHLLAQAFDSLLDNAIKFRVAGVAPRIVIQGTQDADFWRLRISDNGPGVEPAYRDKAFGMFQRLNSEDAYAGVGAGLAICRRIARRHGGDARFVDSDDGACVELALPRAPILQ
jgi:light-regulated signal transduction histidine kinase (bacteriophytochrome)